jgi:hypothetical protein
MEAPSSLVSSRCYTLIGYQYSLLLLASFLSFLNIESPICSPPSHQLLIHSAPPSQLETSTEVSPRTSQHRYPLLQESSSFLSPVSEGGEPLHISLSSDTSYKQVGDIRSDRYRKRKFSYNMDFGHCESQI